MGDLATKLGPTAMSDAQATMLGLKVYHHGTNYNGGIAPTVTPNVSTTSITGRFIPYQTQSGVWRMRYNIRLVFTSSGSDGGITLTGAAAAFDQSGSACQTPGGGIDLGYSAVSGSTFYNIMPAAHGGGLQSGDIELASKPTWAY